MKLWSYLDAKEKAGLVGKILVETWYHVPMTNYWYRRPEIRSLLEWAKENNKGVGSFELPTLREFQKYHWIYLEDSDSVELPEPAARHMAPVLGRMYGPHKVGPYGKYDYLKGE